MYARYRAARRSMLAPLSDNKQDVAAIRPNEGESGTGRLCHTSVQEPGVGYMSRILSNRAR